MDALLFALNAIVPIVLLILVGYFLKKKSFLPENWFQLGNKLIFKICLPCLLFVNVYNIESFAAIDWSVVVYAEAAILLFALFAFLFAKYAIPVDRQKGVIMQCVFRSNFAIIGLPLAESLGGPEGVGIAAVLSAFSIPTFNILAVIALTVFLKDENAKKADFKAILIKIAKNPLILGVLAGLLALGVRSILPVNAAGLPVFSLKEDLAFLFSAVSQLSKMCGPLSLIVLGGLFQFGAVKKLAKPIAIGTVLRLVVVPVVAIGGAILLSRFTAWVQFDAPVYPALLALFASPVAVSSAIMAQEMDNDGTLAGQLVMWTSVFSILTLFIYILLLKNIGLL